jgi:hypothetical protein
LAEHCTENAGVGGSIPPLAPPPNFRFDSALFFPEKVHLNSICFRPETDVSPHHPMSAFRA